MNVTILSIKITVKSQIQKIITKENYVRDTKGIFKSKKMSPIKCATTIIYLGKMTETYNEQADALHFLQI